MFNLKMKSPFIHSFKNLCNYPAQVQPLLTPEADAEVQQKGWQ